MIRIQITDLRMVSREETLARIARGGGPGAVVMLRDPQLTGAELAAWARELRRATHEVGAQLWVNDRLDVAAIIDADGVHLGRRSVNVVDARRLLGEGAVVSMSAHDLDDVSRARDAGAGAVLFSPVFASPGKGASLGLDGLHVARAQLEGSPTRLVALGGIDASVVGPCLAAGAHGVAAIRADLG